MPSPRPAPPPPSGAGKRAAVRRARGFAPGTPRAAPLARRRPTPARPRAARGAGDRSSLDDPRHDEGLAVLLRRLREDLLARKAGSRCVVAQREPGGGVAREAERLLAGHV